MSIELIKVARRIAEEVGYGEELVEEIQRKISKSRNLRDEAIYLASREVARIVRWNARADLNRQNYENFLPRTYDERTRESVREGRALQGYYSYPIWGGILLGDATKEQVMESANHHKELADRNRFEFKFQQLIAEKMSPGQTVKEVYTEEELEKLRNKAMGRREAS